jgi:UDPglucose 6-dehydrogenase
MDAARATERKGVVYCKDEYDAAEGTEVLVIATEWNQFRGLDIERLKRLMTRHLIVDLRNIFDPVKARGAGFDYHGIGR